jgi:hypothetical protein
MIISGESDEPPSEAQAGGWLFHLGVCLGYCSDAVFHSGAKPLDFSGFGLEPSLNDPVSEICSQRQEQSAGGGVDSWQPVGVPGGVFMEVR